MKAQKIPFDICNRIARLLWQSKKKRLRVLLFNDK